MWIIASSFHFGWEEELIVFLQSHMNGFVQKLVELITLLGDNVVTVIIVVLFYFGLNKDFGKKLVTNLMTALVLFPMIKNVALRKRPYFSSDRIKCLKPVEKGADIYDVAAQGYSFPSGHAAVSSTCWGSIALYFKKNWLTIVSILLVLLVGVSRFALGVHYPTDVLCGWVLGSVAIFGNFLLNKYVKKEWVRYLVIALIALPGVFFCSSNDFFTGYGMLLGTYAGLLMEEKYVNFEETKNLLILVVRILGFVAVFLGLKTLLVLPFSKEFLESGTKIALMIRLLKYAISAFVGVGIYPKLFGVVEKNVFHRRTRDDA